ncbi:metal ABC transporter solute-binding protein, Zn/Mn family [Mycobacterium montefiorense]|uniref:ABC transporter substrate-binding protein n=1 Tax=Mycobacterium montefiorense TaxID=154654 RepID=A0AA37PTA8_9MYCO|nr:ABC transporter substrate-binding protein [Mycobacterium montefiorense]GKU33115.1 ABC transporter substrate-binding protein [Mycobacterium montefiorense]GKU38415.1 ABC transporter substrate-binding protein [Mycobacterium montefiorense]GKU46819.1 ABC transporter substrate-binding protein [Mycobacterium montefiorense]GKU51409.1 ABC transporter substrate-binding protein [Mycobacterium montefiorense]
MAQLDAGRRLLGLVSAAFACLIGATMITGCGVAGSSHLHGSTVVASTDVWGSVAHAVAGRHINVKSILSGATIDPHTYQASASDAAAIVDATLVIYNGGGYDPWITSVLTGRANITAVDAYSFVGNADGGNPPNEHVFGDLDVAKTVANTIADRLATIDADNAADYRANAAGFGRDADAIAASQRSIANRYANTSVVATEPVAFYLLKATGLVNRTPPAFMSANENGTDPSPADMAFVLDLFNRHQVAVLLVNPQTSTPAINGLQDAARRAGIPITQVTETLPDGADYLTWQRNTTDQLQAALRSSENNARN